MRRRVQALVVVLAGLLVLGVVGFVFLEVNDLRATHYVRRLRSEPGFFLELLSMKQGAAERLAARRFLETRAGREALLDALLDVARKPGMPSSGIRLLGPSTWAIVLTGDSFLFGAYWSDPRELGQVKFSSLSDFKAAPTLFDAFKELLPVIAGEELVVNRSTPAEPFAALCKVFPGDGALKRSGELRQWQGPGPPPPASSALASVRGAWGPGVPLSALRERLADRDPEARFQAVKYLAAFAPISDFAAAALLDVLGDESPHVRLGAREALIEAGAPAAAGFVRALSSPRVLARLEAARALSRLGPEAAGAAEPLHALAANPDEHGEVRLAAEQALKAVEER